MAKDKTAKNPVSLTDRGAMGHFLPGNPGGPGRPRGSRSKMAELLDLIVEQDAETIARAVLDQARDGEFRAIKLILDRCWPRYKERPLRMALPPAESVADLPRVMNTVLAATAAGELAPAEAAALGAIIDHHRRIHETVELEARLTQIEKRLTERGK